MGNKKNLLETIPIDRVAHALRISEVGIYKLRMGGKLQIVIDDKGMERVSMESFKKVAYSDEIKDLAEEGLRANNLRYNDDISFGKDRIFRQEIETKTKEYKQQIEELQKMHYKYDSRVQVLKHETPVVAAYILFARAISLLKMACLCIGNKFFEATILLRPIDETIQLAEYFILTKEEPLGAKNISDWFRINRIPNNEACRRAIAKNTASYFSPDQREDIEYNIDIIHHLKSKVLHPSFNSIMESHRQKITTAGLVSEGFDYGEPRDPRKVLELTNFFQSSILSTIQAFLKCFLTEMPLDQEDAKKLKYIADKLIEDTN